MKKIAILLLVCLLLTSAAAAADYTVSRLQTDCTVAANGDCAIAQTVELNFPKSVEEVVIPVGTDVVKPRVEGASASFKRQDGQTYATLSNKDGFSGTLTVTVSYTKRKNVSAGDNGTKNFSCELVSALWEVPADRYAFNALLPSAPAETPSFLSGYYAGDVADKMTVKMQDCAVSGIVRGGLMDRESFTMNMTTPAEYFKGGATSGKTAGILCGIAVLLLAALGVFYWFKTLRSAPLRVQARTLPPDGVTPGEMAYLLRCRTPDLALLVCHWASLGYLNITETRTGRVILRRSLEMGNERREEERKIFAALFAASDACETGTPRWRGVAEKSEKLLARYWKRRLFSRDSGSPVILRITAILVCAVALAYAMGLLLPAMTLKWLLVFTAFIAGGACGAAVLQGISATADRDVRWLVIGGVALLLLLVVARLGGGNLVMLAALAYTALCGIVTIHGGKRTDAGRDVMEQTLGFKRFLGHAEDHHLVMMLHRDGQYYYQMAAYAAAAGLGKTFARRFGDAEVESCAFLTLTGAAPKSAAEWEMRFAKLLKAMRVQ